jgi:hypothetical protein
VFDHDHAELSQLWIERSEFKHLALPRGNFRGAIRLLPLKWRF